MTNQLRSPLDIDLSTYEVDHKTGRLRKVRRPGARKQPRTAREAIAKVLRRKPA